MPDQCKHMSSQVRGQSNQTGDRINKDLCFSGKCLGDSFWNALQLHFNLWLRQYPESTQISLLADDLHYNESTWGMV